jgi:uridine kinase
MTRVQLLDYLADRIANVERPHPVRVAIDGVDAAGKTTLADELAQPLRARDRPVIRASVDSFHNPRVLRYRRGPDSPEGYFYDSYDYATLKTLLLDPLGPGGDLHYQTTLFDWRTDSPAPYSWHHAHPTSILLFDGIFLLRPELENCWDFRIFLQVTFDTALQRSIQRDTAPSGTPEAVRDRYERRYRPGQQLYLHACRPAEHATIVVDNNDPLHPRIVSPLP